MKVPNRKKAARVAIMAEIRAKLTRRCSNCGQSGRHFVIPAMGDNGFFICGPNPYDKLLGFKARMVVTGVLDSDESLSPDPRQVPTGRADPEPASITSLAMVDSAGEGRQGIRLTSAVEMSTCVVDSQH